MKKKKDYKRDSSLVSALDVLQIVFEKRKGSFSSEFTRMKLQNHWPQLVGEDFAKETYPRKLYKTTLYVVATSSEARYHFRFSQDVIVNRINAFLGTKLIERISFNPPKEKTDLDDSGRKFLDQIT